jgi:hypothetical protein
MISAMEGNMLIGCQLGLAASVMVLTPKAIEADFLY